MKNNHIILLIIIVFTALWGNSSLWAIQARRDPFFVVQPNGDSLFVMQRGGPRSHNLLTVDGWLVRPDDNRFYRYLMRQEDGSKVISKVAAKDENRRSRKDVKWLKKNGINIFNKNKKDE